MLLDARQNMAIQVSERTMSVLSIAGSLFIIATFFRWKYFRKPINRLVFYASFGNIMTNIATLISTSTLPHSEERSRGICELQGFLIQWFMMADSLWVFCMALNVALVFFHGYDSIQLRRLEKWYILFSYGLPAIPAFIYIILDHTGPQKIIGPATIWCWVSSEVEWLRIAFFYGPVWVTICATLCIHIITGRVIFKKRSALRSFSRQTDSDRKQTVTNPFRDIKVETEIKVESHSPMDEESATESSNCEVASRNSFSSTKNLSPPADAAPVAPGTHSRFSRMSWGAGSHRETSSYSASRNFNVEATPPRFMSVKQPNANGRRTTAMEGNSAAWGYFKVAFLMFAALFIVWVPSTVNRLQQFIHKDQALFGLNLASALVLPLQGFWNAMVYLATTWPECKRALSETMDDLSDRNRIRQVQQNTYRKKVEQTPSANETQEFAAEIPLEEMLKDYDLRHSGVSSTEPMKSPTPPQALS